MMTDNIDWSMKYPVCPSCGSKFVTEIGEIPAENVFASKTLNHVLYGGFLWKCRNCNLYFRWPRLSVEELSRLYINGDIHAWENDPIKRIDWQTAANWITPTLTAEDSVIDIGCSTGLFLTRVLKEEAKKYGVEINKGAAQIAGERGVHIICHEIDEPELDKYRGQFAVVFAFDVIEHVENPLQFLERCKSLVRPDGRIIISTGNTDSIAWRLSKARYWYCTIPEHISFINEKWCDYASKKHGLHLERKKFFSHASSRGLSCVKQTLLNTINIFAPKVLYSMRRSGFGKLDTRKHPELAAHPPIWITAKDHFIVQMQRL